MYIQLEPELHQKLLEQVKEQSARCPLSAIRYLDLGPAVIRILCHTEEIVPILEKQFTYVLKKDVPHYDSTIAVFRQTDAATLAQNLFRNLPLAQKMKIRAEMMWIGAEEPIIQAADKSGIDSLVLNSVDGIVEAYEATSRTYYYGVGNLDPEDFIKFGHCFKQLLYFLLRSPVRRMTHGAVMGYCGNGFLLCGRGKRGKSTLTIQSMLQGFDYVSDDFQLLEMTENGLLAYPIYSVITLSHRMYQEMYGSFKGKFVCNNYEKDKYFFNISAYHSQFRRAYPVRFCLFPEIADVSDPEITLCGPEEKGRAIVHLLHSTAVQMHAENHTEDLRTLFSMVKDLPFYKIRLCPDISANTEALRRFLEENTLPPTDNRPLPRMLKDITFGIATFLDTDTFHFYTMNKFAAEVYRLQCSGLPPEEIRQQLAQYTVHNPNLLNEYDALLTVIEFYGISDRMDADTGLPGLNPSLAEKSGYHLSALGYSSGSPRELLTIKR